MKTIVLRYSDSFAPNNGSLFEHEKILNENGYVWWGKKGPRISPKVISDLFSDGQSKILLIRGGSSEKYWAIVEEIVDECPQPSYVPEYYRKELVFYGSFLKIIQFVKADDDILDHCYVYTTGKCMADIINKAMASYYIVEVK